MSTGDDAPRLRPDDPLARRVGEAIRSADAAPLEQLLRDHPSLWQASALGLVARARDELAQTRPTQEDLDNALWCAAHGGQRETAALLLESGAAPAWVGHDDLTAADAAERSGAHELAVWLREQTASA